MHWNAQPNSVHTPPPVPTDAKADDETAAEDDETAELDAACDEEDAALLLLTAELAATLLDEEERMPDVLEAIESPPWPAPPAPGPGVSGRVSDPCAQLQHTTPRTAEPKRNLANRSTAPPGVGGVARRARARPERTAARIVA